MTLKNSIFKRLLCSALLIVLALLAGCAVNPVTGEQEIVLMSEQQELAMGAQYYPQTTQMNNGLVPHDQALQSYVSQVGHKLARASHRPNIPWEFNVVNSDQVNAFALPGGKISLTRGLLANMKSEDEMASVLAHEIGHVTARHSVAQYTRGAFISMAVAGAGVALSNTDYAEAGAMAAGAAGSLLMLSYSRDQERQADELGYEYMVRSGYNPVGQVRTFEMFGGLNKSEPDFIAAMLSSHPLTTDRVQAAQRRLEAAPLSVRNRPLKTARFSQVLAQQTKRQPAYAAEAKGDAYMKNKSYKAAANQYHKAARLYKGDGIFLTKLAIAEYRQKNVGQAKRDAAKGARISPNVYFPNFVAGAIHYQTKDYTAAQRYLSQADKLLPSQSQNKLLLAASYERLGNSRAAASYYRQVINLSPKSREAGTAAYRLRQMGYR
jgi:predicted Zn-dependent protease